jgi:hypothetical protein
MPQSCLMKSPMSTGLGSDGGEEAVDAPGDDLADAVGGTQFALGGDDGQQPVGFPAVGFRVVQAADDRPPRGVGNEAGPHPGWPARTGPRGSSRRRSAGGVDRGALGAVRGGRVQQLHLVADVGGREGDATALADAPHCQRPSRSGLFRPSLRAAVLRGR